KQLDVEIIHAQFSRLSLRIRIYRAYIGKTIRISHETCGRDALGCCNRHLRGHAKDTPMGPFPHDAPPAKLGTHNPAGTDGFEFVEFATPEPGKLEALLDRMGFVEVARHKSRDISLYRQGTINYIVNREPHTHAARFVAAHGPCAPAMAWRVVDA